MQFTARLDEGQYMREFFNIFSTVSKLAKECVLNLLPDKLCVVANEESGSQAPLVWADINTDHFFSHYLLQSPAIAPYTASCLVLTASPLHLCRALGALKINAIQCHIKLIKLQYHCLRIEVEVPSLNSDQLHQLVNDVPVTIVQLDEWHMYRMPELPKVSLIIGILPIHLLRTLLERMEHLTPSITFIASTNGELNLTVNTDMVSITTSYKNQEMVSVNGSDVVNHRVASNTSCSVDCKRVSMFLSALQVNVPELLCGIEQEHYIYLTANVQSGVKVHALFAALDI